MSSNSIPSYQLGFAMPKIEHVIVLADKDGGCQEGAIYRDGHTAHVAMCNPNRNTIELYTDMGGQNGPG